MNVSQTETHYLAEISADELLDLFRKYNLITQIHFLCHVIAPEIKFQATNGEFGARLVTNVGLYGLPIVVNFKYSYSELHFKEQNDFFKERNHFPPHDYSGTLSNQVMTWIGENAFPHQPVEWVLENYAVPNNLSMHPIALREQVLQFMINQNVPSLKVKILKF